MYKFINFKLKLHVTKVQPITHYNNQNIQIKSVRNLMIWNEFWVEHHSYKIVKIVILKDSLNFSCGRPMNASLAVPGIFLRHFLFNPHARKVIPIVTDFTANHWLAASHWFNFTTNQANPHLFTCLIRVGPNGC